MLNISYAYLPSVYFLWSSLCSDFLFIFEFDCSIFYAFLIKGLCDMCVCRYFFSVCGLSFYSLNSVFCRKVLNFNPVQLTKFSFRDHAFVTTKVHWKIQGHLDFSPMLSSGSFIALHFTFRSMSPFC